MPKTKKEKRRKSIIDFKLSNGEVIKLRLIKGNPKKFIAEASNFGIFGFGDISIEDTFNIFPYKEQNSIILHELWHYKNNIKFEFSILFSKRFWTIFCNNRLRKLQEFEADKYASIKNGKSSTINVLKRIKKMVESKEIPYNLKTHPPIDERIEKIKQWKNVK